MLKNKILLFFQVPYSKPIPKNFQAHWNHAAVGDGAVCIQLRYNLKLYFGLNLIKYVMGLT